MIRVLSALALVAASGAIGGDQDGVHITPELREKLKAHAPPAELPKTSADLWRLVSTNSTDRDRRVRESYELAKIMVDQDSARAIDGLGRIASGRALAVDAAFKGLIFSQPSFTENAEFVIKKALPIEMIVGGERTNQFASAVALLDSSGRVVCSAVARTPTRFITAAHCIADGAVALDPGPLAGGRSIRVKLLPHEQYNSGTKEHDIATGEVDDAKFTFNSVASLGLYGTIDSAKDILVVGYGLDGDGLVGTRAVVDAPVAFPRCDSAVPSQLRCNSREFIAGSKGLGRDSCSGDSGGPAFVHNTLLVGITLRSIDANCGDGGYYIRLDKYDEWLTDRGVNQ